MQQGKKSPVVDGLDLRDRLKPDPLVGAVQAPVVHAESGRGGDAEPGEIVADVRRPCDLRRSIQARCASGAKQRAAQCRIARQGVSGPARGDLDVGRLSAGPACIHHGGTEPQQGRGPLYRPGLG
jgi:hypothetical protein